MWEPSLRDFIRQSTLKLCRPTYFETLQAPDGQLCRCLTFYIPRTWCATGNFKVGNSLPPSYIPVHRVYGSLVGHRWSTLYVNIRNMSWYIHHIYVSVRKSLQTNSRFKFKVLTYPAPKPRSCMYTRPIFAARALDFRAR